MEHTALITNEAVVFGLLMAVLGGIFWAASEPRFKKFFSIVPALLLCYFAPRNRLTEPANRSSDRRPS